LEVNPHQMDLLTKMQSDNFIVPKLLQSQVFRSLLMDAVVRLVKNPAAGRVPYSKVAPDGTLIDPKRLEHRRKKAEAKEAELLDPGEVLAGCNTIDECFHLFDEDRSGEIDVEEMEQMQSLIGDFGEVLIKELYRITALKEADEEGHVEGLTIEEFTGTFCSTMVGRYTG